MNLLRGSRGFLFEHKKTETAINDLCLCVSIVVVKVVNRHL